jgi:molybdate transport system regulatory protein
MGLSVRSKIWLVLDDKIVFGHGRAALLQTIKEEGSLSAAAKKLNISYRHAWGYLQASERRLGFKLLSTSIGGSGGGGAALTEKAEALLKRYQDLHTWVNREANKKFEAVFADLKTKA